METMLLDRDQVVTFVSSVLEEFEPTARLVVYRSDGTIIISPEHDQHDLLAWAEQVGDQYDDVFRQLAE